MNFYIALPTATSSMEGCEEVAVLNDYDNDHPAYNDYKNKIRIYIQPSAENKKGISLTVFTYWYYTTAYYETGQFMNGSPRHPRTTGPVVASRLLKTLENKHNYCQNGTILRPDAEKCLGWTYINFMKRLLQRTAANQLLLQNYVKLLTYPSKTVQKVINTEIQIMIFSTHLVVELRFNLFCIVR